MNPANPLNAPIPDFPSEFTTERLLIRMPMPGDGKAVHAAMLASMAELKPWMMWAQREQTEQEVEMVVLEAHLRFLRRENLRMHVYLKETGEFIASSGLHNINWSVPKFEIGYWIDSRHAGKGYITEAAAGITDFCFNELKAKRVEIRCDADNAKSRAIPERLGYTLDGILKNEALAVDGSGLKDTCIFSKIK